MVHLDLFYISTFSTFSIWSIVYSDNWGSNFQQYFQKWLSIPYAQLPVNPPISTTNSGERPNSAPKHQHVNRHSFRTISFTHPSDITSTANAPEKSFTTCSTATRHLVIWHWQTETATGFPPSHKHVVRGTSHEFKYLSTPEPASHDLAQV